MAISTRSGCRTATRAAASAAAASRNCASSRAMAASRSSTSTMLDEKRASRNGMSSWRMRLRGMSRSAFDASSLYSTARSRRKLRTSTREASINGRMTAPDLGCMPPRPRGRRREAAGAERSRPDRRACGPLPRRRRSTGRPRAQKTPAARRAPPAPATSAVSRASARTSDALNLEGKRQRRRPGRGRTLRLRPIRRRAAGGSSALRPPARNVRRRRSRAARAGAPRSPRRRTARQPRGHRAGQQAVSLNGCGRARIRDMISAGATGKVRRVREVTTVGKARHPSTRRTYALAHLKDGAGAGT